MCDKPCDTCKKTVNNLPCKGRDGKVNTTLSLDPSVFMETFLAKEEALSHRKTIKEKQDVK